MSRFYYNKIIVLILYNKKLKKSLFFNKIQRHLNIIFYFNEFILYILYKKIDLKMINNSIKHNSIKFDSCIENIYNSSFSS